MKKINFRRVFLIGGLSSLVMIYIVLWMRMISNPAERTGADFIAFYSAGQIVQTEGAGHVYDPEVQKEVQETLVGFPLVPGQVLVYNHVPFIIPIFKAVFNQNYVASFVYWVVLLLVLSITGVCFLGELQRQVGWRSTDIWVAGAGMVTFFPVFVSLINGQDTALLFLGACLWLFGLIRGRDDLAGSGLALMTIRLQVALLLAIPFLFKKPRIFIWFCVGAGFLSALSLFILGMDGVRSYINILGITAGGEWYGMNQSAMVNLIGLLLRLVPGWTGESIRVLGWTVFGLTMVGMCVVWKLSKRIDERLITLAVILTVFTSPHLHYHDLTLLLAALFPVMMLLVQGGYFSIREVSLAPLLVSFILLIGSLIPGLKNNIPYLVMTLLLLAAWFPGKLFFWKRQTDELVT
jgi:hypothetical protein